MSEKALRNLYLFGTLFFLIVLGVMSADSLSQVRQSRQPALTADVVAGKQIWQSKNCNDCHTILGIGGYFAPEMTKIATMRDPAWLTSFLLDPQAVKPGTSMPNQMLSAVQAGQVVSFFEWVAQVDTNGWPPQPLGLAGGAAAGSSQNPVTVGQQVYAQKGCSACHMINGVGAAAPGPDLSKIGSQPYAGMPNDPASLTLWLQDPPAFKPGTTMPRIPMTDAEIEALVAYLTSLQ